MHVAALRRAAAVGALLLCAGCGKPDPAAPAGGAPGPALGLRKQATAPPVQMVAAPAPPVPAAQPPKVAEERRPLACFDSETVSAVLDIIREQMLPGEANRTMSQSHFDARVSLEVPRPLRWDKDVALYECASNVIVDSSRGGDAFGQALLTNPQLLHAAGSSVAEVERVIAAGMAPDRQRFTYPLRFTSQLAGLKPYVSVSPIGDVQALLNGSFAAAHLHAQPAADKNSEPDAEGPRK